MVIYDGNNKTLCKYYLKIFLIKTNKKNVSLRLISLVNSGNNFLRKHELHLNKM